MKKVIEDQKLELKQSHKLVTNIQPKMDALMKEKQRLFQEREHLNQALISTTKEVKQSLKAKNKEIARLEEESEARYKSAVKTHRKELSMQESKLMDILG